MRGCDSRVVCQVPSLLIFAALFLVGSVRGGRTLGHLSVVGRGGQERLFALMVSSKSGLVYAKELTVTDSQFDALASGEDLPPDGGEADGEVSN